MIHSYSSIDQFQKCPEAMRQIYVLKSYKKTWTTAKGIDEHALLEARLKPPYKDLPPALGHAEKYVQSMESRGVPVQVEVSLAVDRQLHAVDFWDKAAYLRGKYDVRILAPPRALIGDWKTGKRRESPDQLEIGALLTFANNPTISEVTGVNVWLNAGGLGPSYLFRREEGERWIPWLKKMHAIETADPAQEWETRPSGLCPYCPVKVCKHYQGG